jgi:hypothetical protein
MVVGTENLLIGMIKKPDKVKQLMEVITENNERYIARMLEMGIGVGFADPVSTTSLLRVKQYREFSLPYFQHNVDFIKLDGSKMLFQPSPLDFGNRLIIGGSRNLSQPRDNHNFMALCLQPIKTPSKHVHVKQDSGFGVGPRILSPQVSKPTFHSVQICDSSIHVKANPHFFYLLSFTVIIITDRIRFVNVFFL